MHIRKLLNASGALLGVILCSLLLFTDANASAGLIAGIGVGMPPLMAAAGAFGAAGGMGLLRRQFGTKGGEGGGGGDDDPVKITAQLKDISDQVKDFATKSKAEIEKHGKLSEDTKKSVDDLLLKQGELDTRLKEVEQKAARRGGGAEAIKSMGQEFVEREDVKAFMAKKSKGSVKMDLKAITSATSGAGAAGDLVRPERLANILALPDRRMTVRDLITPGSTGSNAIEYVKETGFTNSAAVVAENTTKPESSITFDLVLSPVVTLAHWLLASKQILDDAPMLQSYIDGRLRYGLSYVEEAQLLMGSGSGGNLNGIYTQATAYSAPFVLADATMIDQLRLALLQAELAEFPSTGIVLHPSDWARIELTKTTEGAYLFANPTSQTQPMLWGRPVVATQAMTIDKFLVGAFKLGAQVFDREQAGVELSTEDSDNFRKNMVTIRAEERLALAVYRPEAFVKGDLGNVA